MDSENLSSLIRLSVSDGQKTDSSKTRRKKQQQQKKKTTPAVKFLDLSFRNNFFIFNLSNMCSR